MRYLKERSCKNWSAARRSDEKNREKEDAWKLDWRGVGKLPEVRGGKFDWPSVSSLTVALRAALRYHSGTVCHVPLQVVNLKVQVQLTAVLVAVL